MLKKESEIAIKNKYWNSMNKEKSTEILLCNEILAFTFLISLFVLNEENYYFNLWCLIQLVILKKSK